MPIPILLLAALTLLGLFWAWTKARDEARQWHENSVAITTMNDSQKVNVVKFDNAREFAKMFPAIKDSIEKVFGVKINRLTQALATAKAELKYVDFPVLLHDTILQAGDTVKIGRVAYLKTECIDSVILFPNDSDTASIDLDLELDVLTVFSRERQNKWGKRAKWQGNPFRKWHNVAEVKVMCGQKEMQNSIKAFSFKE